ncbi:MAG: isoaspartyl peptidase/L-asparaginase [Myxococcales bacterium]|nr:isoaspartyl peptidase/L-asparaginase [Myxococcales bacterium]
MRPPRPIVIVHGGAGQLTADRRPAHLAGCERAAEAGLALLLAGGSALDAVVAAVQILEDDPVFNAGTGGSLSELGELEFDAAVMEGAALRFGGVAALRPFRHPIAIARAALEDGRHALYAGEGAAAFARGQGFEEAPPATMITERARERLRLQQQGLAGVGWAGGTVGAVAFDRQARTAAATSTGGTVGKRRGRVGDSPLPGAGTYADDRAGAISATGIGEAILRYGLAHEIALRMRGGLGAQLAAGQALAELEARVDGRAGVIVLDTQGRAGVCHNTESMSHAIAREGEPIRSGA